MKVLVVEGHRGRTSTAASPSRASVESSSTQLQQSETEL